MCKYKQLEGIHAWKDGHRLFRGRICQICGGKQLGLYFMKKELGMWYESFLALSEIFF